MALKERYCTSLEKCLKSLTTWKNFINENIENSDKKGETEKFEGIVKDYCCIDEDYRKSEEIINLMQDQLGSISKLEDIETVFQEKISKQPDADITSSDIWDRFCSTNISIQEVKRKKKADKSEYVELDESILCSNTFTPPIDPISKTVITNPVKNIICGHIYHYDSIYDYIRQSKNKAKCPYMGCNNNKLKGKDIKEDVELKNRIEQYLANRQDQTSSDEDD